jgi:hypothetical protein
MTAEVLAARPDQLDASIQDQGECLPLSKHYICPLHRGDHMAAIFSCLSSCSKIAADLSVCASIHALHTASAPGTAHIWLMHIVPEWDAYAAGVATRLLASLLNPYSGEVRLAARATLQRITQAAPHARVWLLQLLGTAQAVLMGEQTLVRTLICGPAGSICTLA